MNGVTRRWCVAALLITAVVAAAPCEAQQVYRVGVLTPAPAQWQQQTVMEALDRLGYAEGRNLQLIVRSADGQLERLPELARELVQANPHVIIAVNTPGTRAAMQAGGGIPIVSGAVGDPVFLGLVKSLARPEGQVTGVANMASDITTKRVALLKEAVPAARRIALFIHPDEPIVTPQLRDIEAAAASLGIEYRTFPMRTEADLESGLQGAVQWRADGIVRLAGQGFTLGPLTGRRATELRIPAMAIGKADVEAGALMSYFADNTELWRQIAAYVDRILKGAKPDELPFVQPTKFELVLNLKTANALGLTLPASLIARADDVIE